jgi:putative transposase
LPYYQLYYHIVWATKFRSPLLTPEVEPVIHGYCRSKAVGLGATVYALNGAEDHVHLVVTIPPSISVAKFVG